MKRVLTEKTLRNIIKRTVSEALNYDKERKQYFPQYTTNDHSNAGKYAYMGGDNEDYAHNDYHWYDPQRQKKFQKFQDDNGFSPNPFSPDREGESGGEDYLRRQNGEEIAWRAAEETMDEFDKTINNFCKEIAHRYPVLKDHYYMDIYMHELRKHFSRW